MYKRKTASDRVLLILLLIIFQLVFGIFINAYLDSRADGLSYPLSRSNRHIEKIFLLGNLRKAELNYINFNSYDLLIDYVYISNASENNNFYYKKLFDNKSEVKKAVHHHFHGSKYKESCYLVQRNQNSYV